MDTRHEERNELDLLLAARTDAAEERPRVAPRSKVAAPAILDVPAPDARLVAFHDLRAPATEQYRSLRTNLLALDGHRAPRVIVVTSAVKGEGKSVTTLNLAAVLAETPGAKVVVVDADLRCPSVHSLLGHRNRAGLTEVLKGEIPLPEALRPSCLDGLDILTAGRVEEAPLELFSRGGIQDLLTTLRAAYDFVLVDTPPVFTVTDAAVVGALADGVLLVVRRYGAPTSIVEKAVEALRSARTRVLGCVMTGMSPDRKYGRYPYADEIDQAVRS
jgi:receptor protein-tyrosine kinase